MPYEEEELSQVSVCTGNHSSHPARHDDKPSSYSVVA